MQQNSGGYDCDVVALDAAGNTIVRNHISRNQLFANPRFTGNTTVPARDTAYVRLGINADGTPPRLPEGAQTQPKFGGPPAAVYRAAARIVVVEGDGDPDNPAHVLMVLK